MPGSPLALRGLTWLAAAFLGFDGAALAAIGIWAGRLGLTIAGTVLFLGAGFLLLYGRGQRRRLDEIAAARRELRDETEALRRLLEP